MRIQREKNVDKYIIEALFILMKNKEYNKISITEITGKAGVGRVSFYRNFDSKEDIIEKWISMTTDVFLNSTNINYKTDDTKSYFIKLFTHLNSYKEETILIYDADLMHLLKKEFDNKFLLLNKEKYNNYKSYFIAGGIYNIFYYWIINGFKETPEDIANKLIDLLKK